MKQKTQFYKHAALIGFLLNSSCQPPTTPTSINDLPTAQDFFSECSLPNHDNALPTCQASTLRNFYYHNINHPTRFENKEFLFKTTLNIPRPLHAKSIRNCYGSTVQQFMLRRGGELPTHQSIEECLLVPLDKYQNTVDQLQEYAKENDFILNSPFDAKYTGDIYFVTNLSYYKECRSYSIITWPRTSMNSNYTPSSEMFEELYIIQTFGDDCP